MPIAPLLNELIKRANGSRKKAAQILDISEGYLSLLLSGAREPGNELHQKIADAAHGKFTLPEDLRTPAYAGIRWAPVVSYVQAGTIAGDYQDLCNQIDERVETDCRAPNVFAVRIIGDSMEPEAFDGDLAIVNPNTEPQSGRPAIVKIKDTGETMIKWFFRQGERGEKILLGSENPVHQPINLRADELEWAYLVYDIRRQRRTRRAGDFVQSKRAEQPGRNIGTNPAGSSRNK